MWKLFSVESSIFSAMRSSDRHTAKWPWTRQRYLITSPRDASLLSVWRRVITHSNTLCYNVRVWCTPVPKHITSRMTIHIELGSPVHLRFVSDLYKSSQSRRSMWRLLQCNTIRCENGTLSRRPSLSIYRAITSPRLALGAHGPFSPCGRLRTCDTCTDVCARFVVYLIDTGEQPWNSNESIIVTISQIFFTNQRNQACRGNNR